MCCTLLGPSSAKMIRCVQTICSRPCRRVLQSFHSLGVHIPAPHCFIPSCCVQAVAAGATNCVRALLEWALEQDQGLNEETCPMSERTSNSSGGSTPGGDQSMASSPAGISRPASPHSTGAGALPSHSGPGVSAVQPRSPASPHARMETAHSGVGRSTLSRCVGNCGSTLTKHSCCMPLGTH